MTDPSRPLLPSVNRRTFLQVSAAAMLAPMACTPEATPPENTCVDTTADADDGAVRTSFAADAVPQSTDLFPQGVAAGSMSASAVTLWGRLQGDPATVAAQGLVLRVWRDVDGAESEDAVDLVQEIEVTPQNDVEDGVDEGVSGIVKLRVEGLSPGTHYRYGFFVRDGADGFTARSSIGLVRTALAADTCQPVVFGATTCTNPRNAPFGTLTQLAQDDDVGPLDALLHVGDMVYADGSRTATDYRRHWRAAMADPGYRAILEKTGMYLSWDDHEFDNNINPEETPAVRIETAKAAFFEGTPTEPGEDGAWTFYQWGNAVEVIQLDARTERTPSTRADDVNAYLSEAQMSFLKDRLQNSPCHFKVVMNSVPMTKMPELWALQGDRWQGYEPAREEILNFLEDNDIDNVWFISGDFHVGFVGRLEQTGFRSKLWEIAVGPGGNLGNPIMAFVLAGQREDVFPAAQFTYGEGRMAATRLRFDPGTDSVRIKFTTIDGEVLYDETLSRKS